MKVIVKLNLMNGGIIMKELRSTFPYGQASECRRGLMRGMGYSNEELNRPLIGIINSWNEYLSALVFLPSSEKFTVSQGIQFWMAMSDEHNLMMTAAASAIVPVVILFLFTQKYFVESIATTGVKG